jgi:branched-chain amino acid transport system ATP-binding protein
MPAKAIAPQVAQISTLTRSGASLEARSIARAFGGVKAVREASFKVGAGTVHALIGPNGAGKTTIINLITGFYRPDAGQILLDGAPLKARSMDAAARLGIARTFQTIKLFGNMTVLEHVMVGLSAASGSGLWSALSSRGGDGQQDDHHTAKARELLGFVGLSGFETVPANTLAYGHRRLLEIARALAVEPRVLLLDEPAAGLVAEEILALGDVIVRLKKSGMTIVLVEHHMDLVVQVSDRITVIDYGTVIAEGSPAEVQRNERVIAAYLGPSHVAA